MTATASTSQLPVDVEIPNEIPILPLLSSVLFPSGILSLQVAIPRNIALLASLREEQDVIGLHHVKGEHNREPPVESLSRIGVAARIVQRLRMGGDRLQVFLHGIRRIELGDVLSTEPFFVARVRPVPEPEPSSALELDVLMGRAIRAWEVLTGLDGKYSKETVDVLRMNLDLGAGHFSDLLATYLNVSLEEKQELVEMLSPRRRIERLVELIEREAGKLTVENDLKEQVKIDIEKKQREYFLREEMRVIQEELGETREAKAEAAEIVEKIGALPIDDDSKDALRREANRLAILSEHSSDYPVLRNYFDTVFSLPWHERTKDSLDVRKVERSLSHNHYGVGEVKDRVVEYLSVAKLKGQLAGPILCLAGPPGTGKTTIARSIAEALGRKFIRISLGGVSDESEIRGHRKTYIGAMPGKIIAAYARVRSRNPVILIDEVDKLGKDFRGDPGSALLEVLDPEQNQSFVDRYLGIPFDLSDTLFIATANMLDTIPPALRDRFEVLQLSGYTLEEKLEIARRHIVPSQIATHGLEKSSVNFTRGALTAIARGYTAEAGVRAMERKLAQICRKVARERATKRGPTAARRTIRESSLERYLGPVVYEREYAERNPETGFATGLAWTVDGGSILFIEATRMQGTGKVEVTGHLGEVMKESVHTAFSYVRSRAKDLDIRPDIFAQSDVHIHFPAGAIPKDGPSAGVAVATCLASLLSERPVRHDVAMTGEITLRGKVLSVGGIKEKVLAAHRAGIQTVVLPEGNRKDLPSVPATALKDLKVLFAARVEDVWHEALMGVLIPREFDPRHPLQQAELIIQQDRDDAPRPRRSAREGGDGMRR